MSNSSKIYEKIKKYTMIYRARQMKLNVSKNPDEEVIALYDAELKDFEMGRMVAIIINNPKERYLRFLDKDDGFDPKKEIRVDGNEYRNLIMNLKNKREWLEHVAHSEIKIVEATYGRKQQDQRKKTEDKEPDEKKGFAGKIQQLSDRITNYILDRIRLNDYDDEEEYDDEYDDEYDEEYDDHEDDYYSISDTIKEMVEKASQIGRGIIQKDKKEEKKPNVLYLDNYRVSNNGRKTTERKGPNEGPNNGPGGAR